MQTSLAIWLLRVLWPPLLVATTTSCSPKAHSVNGFRVLDDLGATLPAVGAVNPTVPLRFDCLYATVYQEPVGYGSTRKMISVTAWFRFWPDGRVFMGGKDSGDLASLSARDGDTFSRGGVGRYSLVGPELRIESGTYFADEYWDYLTEFGRLDNESITIYASQRRANRPGSHRIEAFAPVIYHRIEVGPMRAIPFW